MISRLGIASSLTVVCAGFGLLVAVLAGSYLVFAEYNARVDDTVRRNERLLAMDNGLQFAVYFRDIPVLRQYVRTMLGQPGVDYVVVRDSAGNVLASRADGRLSPPPPDQSSWARGNPGEQQTVRLSGNSYLQSVIPVYAAVDPLQTPDGSADYGSAFGNYPATMSRHLAGSVQFGVNLASVRDSLRPMAVETALVLTACFLGYLLFVSVAIRAMTAPLKQLADFARDITSGRLDRPLRLRGAGEIARLVESLNTVLDELGKHKSLVDIDNKLLSMKVEERTRQLTLRNEELNEAVEEISKAESQLKQLAYFDSLTSLPNRQLFLLKLEELIEEAAAEDRLLALLYMDLDNFKRINDSLGHSIGDELLKAVADRMDHCLRHDDLLAVFPGDKVTRAPGISRLGGDEFTVILRGIEQEEDAAAVAQRILDALQEPFLLDFHELVVTPSIGLALSPRDSDDAEELVKMADTAMYQAKKAGKNTFRFYRPDMNVTSIFQLQVEADLRKAIAGREITLFFQPQVDVSNGRIVGAEALARWEHPERGHISPVQFIPLAEDLGIIQELGLWVIQHACRQLREIQGFGLDVPVVSVNVSPLQFTTAFVPQLKEILDDVGIRPDMLMLELTEGTLMRHEDYVVDALFQLKDMGIQLAIDDFGTGYSSLSYLTRFPIDELKIDRSFVVQIADPSNTASRSLIDAIVAMARSMNLEVVAEGVDNALQLEYLRGNGVNVIQGYLFSKPLQFEEFVLFLEDNPFPKNLLKMSRAMAQQEEAGGVPLITP